MVSYSISMSAISCHATTALSVLSNKRFRWSLYKADDPHCHYDALIHDSNASRIDNTAENKLEVHSIWVSSHVFAASEPLIHMHSSRLILAIPIPLTLQVMLGNVIKKSN